MKIEFENLSKQFEQGRRVLEPLDFSDDVHTMAIIGPSGGGKSTLLRILGGLIAPTTGILRVNGETVETNEAALQKYRRKLGFVFQQGGLFRHMNARANITTPLERVHGFSREEACERAMELLERFGLKDDWKKKPAELSGGQQQRVAIGRALITRPMLILADEPTGNLDTQNSNEVIALLKNASKRYEQTIIMITHNRSIASTADRILQVSDGIITDFGRCGE